MKKIIKNLLTGILSVVLFSSCFSYKEVEFSKTKIEGIEKVTGEGMNMLYSVKINNPNDFDINVIRGSFQSKIKGNVIGKTQVEEFTLPKESNKRYKFNIRSKPKQIKKALGNAMISVLSSGKISVKTTGYVKLKIWAFINKTHEIEHKEKLNPAELLLNE